MALIICPECGKQISDKAVCCIYCGYPLSKQKNMKFCPYCGKQVEVENQFCPYCGKSFINGDVSNAPPTEETNIVDIMDFKSKLDHSDDPTKLQQTQLIQQQRLLEEQQKQYDAQAKCPRCGSTSLSGGKQGFGVGKAVAGAALFGGVGVLAGGIGANKTVVTCLNCGYKFKL